MKLLMFARRDQVEMPWTYYDGDTKMQFGGEAASRPEWAMFPTFEALVRAVVVHRQTNQLAVASNIAHIIEDQLARSLPPAKVKERPERKDPAAQDANRLGGNIRPPNLFARIQSATATLAHHVFGGNDFVLPHIAGKRAQICGACPLNSQDTAHVMCPDCIAGVAKLAGGRRHDFDGRLGVCQACGCFNAAKIHFGIESIAKGTTKEVMDTYAARAPECWVYRGIMSLPPDQRPGYTPPAPPPIPDELPPNGEPT